MTANNTRISLCNTNAATNVNIKANVNTIEVMILVGLIQALSCRRGPTRNPVALTANRLPIVYGTANREGLRTIEGIEKIAKKQQINPNTRQIPNPITLCFKDNEGHIPVISSYKVGSSSLPINFEYLCLMLSICYLLFFFFFK